MEAHNKASNAQNMKSAGILLNYVTAHEDELKVQRTCSAVRKLERLTREEVAKLPNDSPLHKILRVSGWRQARFQFSTECPIDVVSLKHKLASLYLDRVSLQHHQDSGRLIDDDVGNAIKSFCPDTLVRCAVNGILKSKEVPKNHGRIEISAAIAAAVKSVSANFVTYGSGGGRRAESAESMHSSVSFFGTCMLVDISGFTKLSAALCTKGSAGLDDLHLAISGYLGRCVDIVYAHGGDVISFAGDALICIFSDKRMWSPASASTSGMEGTCNVTPDETLDERYQSKSLSRNGGSPMDPTPNALAAVRCAMELKEHCTDTLTAHVALSCGEMSFAMLGGLNDEYICMVLGKCLNEIATCIDDAKSKQLVVTPSVFHWVQQEMSRANYHSGSSAAIARGMKSTQIFPSENYRIESIEGASVTSVVPRRLQEFSDLDEIMDKLRKFVPPNLLDSLAATNHITSELREVTTIFLKLDSFDAANTTEESVPLLQRFFLMVQQVLADTGGFMRQFLLDDKGCVLIAMWGVPLCTYPNNCSRAIRAATAIIQNAKEMQQLCSVGITTGQVYCGAVGSLLRREYVGIGSAVNLSARLMGKARGRILIDEETQQRLPLNIRDTLREAERLRLKGIKSEVTAFMCPSSLENVVVSTIVDDARDQAVYIHGNLMEALSVQLNKLSVCYKDDQCSGISGAAAQDPSSANAYLRETKSSRACNHSNSNTQSDGLGVPASLSVASRLFPSLSSDALTSGSNSYPPREVKNQPGTASASSSSSSFTVILGPAGSGKSSCAEYFRRGAAARGLNCVFVRVLKGDEHIAYKTLGKLLIELIGPYDLSSERRQKVTLVRLVKQVVPDRNALDVLGESRTVRTALGYKWLAGLEANAVRKFEEENNIHSFAGNGSSVYSDGGNVVQSLRSFYGPNEEIYSPAATSYDRNKRNGHSGMVAGADSSDAGDKAASVVGSYQGHNDNGSEISDHSLNVFTLREKGPSKFQPDGSNDHLISKLLLLLLRQRPTAIVIDDAHNADELSCSELHRIQKFSLDAAFLILLSRPYTVRETEGFHKSTSGTNDSRNCNESFASAASTTVANSLAVLPSSQGKRSNETLYPASMTEGSGKQQSPGQSSPNKKARYAWSAMLRAMQSDPNCVTLEIPPLGPAEVQQLLIAALAPPNLRRLSVRAQTLGGVQVASPTFSTSYQVSRELVDAVLQVSYGNAFWCRIIADFIVERGVKDFMRCVHNFSDTVVAENNEGLTAKNGGNTSAEISWLKTRSNSTNLPTSSSPVAAAPLLGRGGVSKSASFRKPLQERNPLNVLAVYCLETLAPSLQVLIKHAAIIGHEFTHSELCAALPDVDADSVWESAELLLESGFILSFEDAEIDAPKSYCFQNCLMRDAIYNLMPPSQASKIHELVAQHIHASNAEDLEPHLGSLCYHYSHVPDRQYDAFAFAIMAARQSITQQALYDCLFFVNCAVEVCSKLPKKNPYMVETVQAIMDKAIELLQPVRFLSSMANRVRALYSQNYVPVQLGLSNDLDRAHKAHLLDAFKDQKLKLSKIMISGKGAPERPEIVNQQVEESPQLSLGRIAANVGSGDCFGCNSFAGVSISPNNGESSGNTAGIV